MILILLLHLNSPSPREGWRSIWSSCIVTLLYARFLSLSPHKAADIINFAFFYRLKQFLIFVHQYQTPASLLVLRSIHDILRIRRYSYILNASVRLYSFRSYIRGLGNEATHHYTCKHKSRLVEKVFMEVNTHHITSLFISSM